MSAPTDPTEPSCPSGKGRYRTWTHAAYDARAMRRHRGGKNSTEGPYSCRLCSGFHVGAQSKSPNKKKDQR